MPTNSHFIYTISICFICVSAWFIAANLVSSDVVSQELKMLRRMSIVAIIRSTATAKTKLSIELAKKFNGEVISADFM